MPQQRGPANLSAGIQRPLCDSLTRRWLLTGATAIGLAAISGCAPMNETARSGKPSLGVLAHVDDACWVLPPTRALWLPAGVVHRTGATREAVLCSLYLEPDRCDLDCADPTPVGVDGLLAHLIAYLSRKDLHDDPRLQAEAVVLDLLRPLPATPIDVPHPTDDRVRAVADALLANPADSRSLEAYARAIGLSRRTLTRLFVHDNGMHFDRWRTHVRLGAALPLLAEGQPVSRVAHTVGYATPSAFLAASGEPSELRGTLPQWRRFVRGICNESRR